MPKGHSAAFEMFLKYLAAHPRVQAMYNGASKTQKAYMRQQWKIKTGRALAPEVRAANLEAKRQAARAASAARRADPVFMAAWRAKRVANLAKARQAPRKNPWFWDYSTIRTSGYNSQGVNRANTDNAAYKKELKKVMQAFAKQYIADHPYATIVHGRRRCGY